MRENYAEFKKQICRSTLPASSYSGLTRVSNGMFNGQMSGFIYILSNKPNGTLYLGVTNNLVRRIYEHREKSVDGFSKKYDLDLLVYYEQHATMPLAIQREKNIKHWVRAWKIELIEELNPAWEDLWGQIVS